MTEAGAARALLTELTAKGPISQRLLIVAAHPDDETMGAGAQLRRLHDALLLHVTDGAPRDGDDMRRYGFSAPADYAAARRSELAAALIAGEAEEVRTAAFEMPDKEAFLDLAGLTRRLLECLRRERPVAVLTHAYEGGHPDHDAVSFGVHAACRHLSAGDRPAIIEMPFYHALDGQLVAGCFLPARSQEVTIRLDEADRERKRRMVDCFKTQREILARFEIDAERFRLAPPYDFNAAPHSGVLLYEMFGWGMDGSDWRRQAVEALGVLGLD